MAIRRPLLAGSHAISHWWVMELRKVPGPHVMGGGAGGGDSGSGGGGGEGEGGGGEGGGGGKRAGGGGECRSRNTTFSLPERRADT
jgi:hypothetical protein